MPTSRPSASTTGASRRRASTRRLEGVLGVDAVVEGHDVADHDVVDLGEPVDAGEVGLGDDADRAVAVGDDGGAVGALVQQGQRLATVSVGSTVMAVS